MSCSVNPKYSIVLGLVLSFLSCNKVEKLSKDNRNLAFSEFKCISKLTEKSQQKDEVLKYIYGNWQLRGMITMVPSDTVSNIKVTFKDIIGAPINKQIADIFINDKPVGSVLYSINEYIVDNINFIQIESDSFFIDNTKEYNFIRGGIRICEEELMIDNGIASDGPGYLFRKI